MREKVLSTLKSNDEVPDAPIDLAWTQKSVFSSEDNNIINEVDESCSTPCAFFTKSFNPADSDEESLKNTIISLCEKECAKQKVIKDVRSIMDSPNFVLDKYSTDALKLLCKTCYVRGLVLVNSRELARIHTVDTDTDTDTGEENQTLPYFIIDEYTQNLLVVKDKEDELKKLFKFVTCNEVPEDFQTLRKYKAFLLNDKSMEKRNSIYEKLKEVFDKQKEQNTTEQ